MNIVRSCRVTVWKVIRTIVPPQQPEERWSWGEFGHKVVDALPYIFVIIMLVSWMEAAGWFRGFETFHLDSMIRAQSLDTSKRIVVVEISEDDYQKIFDGTSPLDRFKLLDLIQAVQKYHPRVIGVDIDTNDWLAPCKRSSGGKSCAENCDRLTKKLAELRAAEDPPPGATGKHSSIVWAAVPRTLEPPLKLNPGVGSLPLESDRQGIPRFPVDDDGSVRHFERRVAVAKSGDACPEGTETLGDKCYAPTFAQAVLEEYTGAANPDSDERVLFNFHGDRYQFKTIDSSQFFPQTVAHETRSSSEIEKANAEIDRSRSTLLAGNVVLIGGGFIEARDEYFTPAGPMEGVKLNALALQTDLDNGGIHDFNELGEWLLDVFISILLVAVFYRYESHPLKAFCISAFAIPVAFLFSVLLFNTAAYWFNFIPVAAGVMVHQLLDQGEGRAHAQRLLNNLRSEPAQMEIDVATVEQIAAEAAPGTGGAIDETRDLEDQKTKGAAAGAP